MLRKRVLVSNLMMLKERDRFEKLLCDNQIEPIFPNVSQCMTVEQCHSYAGEIDGWLAGDDPINRSVLEAHRGRLKIISKWGTGLDSIDLNSAQELGIKVTNTMGAFGEAVGELAVGYIISLVREIVITHTLVQSGNWPKNQHLSLGSSCVGIIGYGAIGQGVAKRLSGLCPNIYYYDPATSSNTVDIAEYKDLTWLNENCDVIVLCCQLTKDTHHLIDREFLDKMKLGSYIVNVSRGPIIEESALIEALRSGQINGAALDVFEIEPLIKNSELKQLNVILGSHNGNNTKQAVEFVHDNTIKNLIENL